MPNHTGLSPKGPTDYRGPNVFLSVVVTRNRAPTSADYRQPETGKLYPFNTFWLVSKDPTTGTQGDLWYLSKIVANVAYWVKLSTTNEGPLLGINVDAFTAPGTNPVESDADGNITVTGGQVATGTIGANVIRTNSLALNTFKIEIQRTTTAAAPNSALNGVSHFNSADFIVDGDGFVSLNGSAGIDWQIITASQTLAVNKGYICAAPGGALSLALPATATLGDIIRVTLDGATSWTITQALGQQIRFNNLQTTSGVGGSLATTDQGNTIHMVAQSATKWNVISALGTLNVV